MQKDTRPDWDTYFMGIANAVATRGDCTRSQVGAVLVSPDNRLLSTGFNGTVPGLTGCLLGGCPRGKFSYEELPPDSDYSNCNARHAEFNAVVYCEPSKREGTTLYITRRPCTECHQLILREGITEIIWTTPDGRIARERQFE